MIKELSEKEIKKTLDHIVSSYSQDERYRYWFNNCVDIPLPVRAFLINDAYYVDIDMIHDVNMLGILKLKDTTEPFLSDIVDLMNELIKEYSVLACFRDKKHKRVKALWKYLERKCNVTTEEIQVDNIIVKIFYKKDVMT